MAEDNDSNGVSVEHEKNDTENSEKAHELNNVKDADLMDLSGEPNKEEENSMPELADNDVDGDDNNKVNENNGEDDDDDEEEGDDNDELQENGNDDEEGEEEEEEESNGIEKDSIDEEENIGSSELQDNSKASNLDEEILISDDEDVDNNVEEDDADNDDSILEGSVDCNDEEVDDDDESQTKSELPNNTSENGKLSTNAVHRTKSEKNQETKEEILIDDDDEEDVDDEDEVQDLSTKTATIEELVPKLTPEITGFPSYLRNIISLGECMAISKKAKSDIDIDKDCSILDCPSQVVPLIIKKSNTFPAKLKVEKEEAPVKPANPPAPANNTSTNNKNMLTISDFYSSSIGKFLIGIGLSRVKQWYHKDAINKVRKQIRKEGEAEDLMEELKKQQEYLMCVRTANSSYLFPTEKCEHCEFRTEFRSIMFQHMLYPHMTSRKEYKCNYCQFSTRDSKTIIGHVNMLHERNCLIEMPPQLYECPICPYESGVKSKAATHIAKCLKFFVPDRLLVIKDDYFPTITPKPITQEDIKIYEATLQALRFAALNPQNKVPPIPGLPVGLQQQMYSIQQQQQQPRSGPGRPAKSSSNKIPRINQFMMNQLSHMNIKNLSPQLYQMLSNAPAGQFLPNSGPGATTAAAASAGNLPIPNALNFMNKHHQMLSKMSNSSGTGRQHQATNMSNQNMNHNPPSNHKTSSVPKANSLPTNRGDVTNSKGSFVMCEICDGYIKDLEQLRTHMHWIHKVRIHPKMLANRPPLNCQKCQWRFFTDQGLERHLLGAHGLVTSNMQDMVNQNQDGGRCTICGRIFTSKLVTHMNQTHKINLKPAHLSYKCTVCSATFNLYRLFENHVYMVHSGSVKRNADDQSSQPPRKKVASMESLIANSAANGN
ncbi:hypothetical protein RDWZM_006847 [Blomia tropicalis]|uniref:MOG interacting and ectopic P-granules protein 1 n=1 Tax=Blomia tropicalis TaxID=40697 RepID=A0A9Q0RNZ4_BLOTA|nr:hypothetical protein RDWZM_006847 [Blomia tropicalis]